METINENLIRAQKHMTKLKDSIDKFVVQPHGKKMKVKYVPDACLNLNTICLVAPDVGAFQNEVVRKTKDAQNEFYKYIKIVEDIENIKLAIHTKNTEVGINKILSKITHLSVIKNYYKSMLESIAQNNKPKDNNYRPDISTTYGPYSVGEVGSLYDKIKTADGQKIVNYTVKIFEADELDSKLRNINKQIELLENDRDKLNATTNVEYQVSAESYSLLGL